MDSEERHAKVKQASRTLLQTLPEARPNGGQGGAVQKQYRMLRVRDQGAGTRSKRYKTLQVRRQGGGHVHVSRKTNAARVKVSGRRRVPGIELILAEQKRHSMVYSLIKVKRHSMLVVKARGQTKVLAPDRESREWFLQFEAGPPGITKAKSCGTQRPIGPSAFHLQFAGSARDPHSLPRSWALFCRTVPPLLKN